MITGLWFVQVTLETVMLILISLVIWRIFRVPDISMMTRMLAKLSDATDRAVQTRGGDSLLSYKLSDNMQKMQATVSQLERNVGDLRDRIIEGVRKEQQDLLRSVQREFSLEIDRSKQMLTQEVERELARVIPNMKHRNELSERVAEFIGYALRSMGEFERSTIEAQSQQALGRVKTNVTGAISEVSTNVNAVRANVESLALAAASSETAKAAHG